jgi:hypothetical protein
VFGNNLELNPGDEIDGNVAVFGGNVTAPAESKINGDLVVFGGNAEIDGAISGNLAVLGGNIDFGSTALVEGDVAVIGGAANVAEGAIIEGELKDLGDFGFGFGDDFDEAVAPPIPPVPPVPALPATPPAPSRPDFGREHGFDFGPTTWVDRLFDFAKYVMGMMAMLVVLAIISWLVATFMPEQMKVVGDTMVGYAPISFGLGLITWIAALVIGVILIITICLAFIPIIAYIILGIATLFGWIVAGQLIGERLLIATGRPYPSFVGSTVLGVLALTIVTQMPVIEYVPCLGFILWLVGTLLGIIVSLTALGSVILTRFGTRPYPQPGSSFGSGSPSGYTPPASPRRSRSEGMSPLDRSEAELMAKIRETLAEADAAPPLTPAPAEPAPGDEETGSPDEPAKPADDERLDLPK